MTIRAHYVSFGWVETVMPMPSILVFVRHGHSEGNLVVEVSKEGDDSLYTPDFRERPGHRWRLTVEGRRQAEVSGRWISANVCSVFDRYYVSPYARTRETAAMLALPDAQWRVDQRLRERDWGDIGSLPRSEFRTNYPQNAFMMESDRLYWRPPGGESIADVRLRVRDLFDTLHRECAGQSVLIVTHGEFMWAARAELEYLTDEEWLARRRSPTNRIGNGEVLHYTRLHPTTGQLQPTIGWVRSACGESSDRDWAQLSRKAFSNEDLLQQVSLIEPLRHREN